MCPDYYGLSCARTRIVATPVVDRYSAGIVELLDKLWSQVCSLLPPQYLPSFSSRMGLGFPTFHLFMLVGYHRVLLPHDLALPTRHIFAENKPLRALRTR